MFEIWHDGIEAFRLYGLYFYDQWRDGFNGTTSFDLAAVTPIVNLHQPDPKAALELILDLKAFAVGVSKYQNELRLKSQK